MQLAAADDAVLAPAPALPTTAALPTTPALPVDARPSPRPPCSSLMRWSLAREYAARLAASLPYMFNSITKELRSRKLITPRQPYRRRDDAVRSARGCAGR